MRFTEFDATWPWVTTQIAWIYQNLSTEHQNQALGKIDCVFCSMKIGWDDGNLPWGLPIIDSLSLNPSSLLPMYLCTPLTGTQPSFNISASPYTCRCSVCLPYPWISICPPMLSPSGFSYSVRMPPPLASLLQADQWLWRGMDCPTTQRSSEQSGSIGVQYCVYIEIQLYALMGQGWSCAWIPCQRNLWDTVGGLDRVCLEMHLQIVIQWTQRCTWRLRSFELRDSLEGNHHVNL